MNNVMGTGSRSMLLSPDRKDIYATLERHILSLPQLDELLLISGMAEGWDEAIAKVGMRNGIPYDVYIPNKGYGQYYWGKNSKLGHNRMNTYNELVDNAREVYIVCNDLYVNGVHCNFIRNQAMVDACDSALVYDAKSRGTRDAVSRLKAAGKPWEVYPFIVQGTLL